MPARPTFRPYLRRGRGRYARHRRTISQSKRLALAWRSPGLPTEESYGRAIESLLIRLADGAVLSRTEGDYWNIGPMHPNHLEQSAAWSANSRFLVEIVDLRWWTHNLRLYAIGTDDSVRVVDLKAIVEPAVRKHLRGKEPITTFRFSVAPMASLRRLPSTIAA